MLHPLFDCLHIFAGYTQLVIYTQAYIYILYYIIYYIYHTLDTLDILWLDPEYLVTLLLARIACEKLQCCWLFAELSCLIPSPSLAAWRYRTYKHGMYGMYPVLWILVVLDKRHVLDPSSAVLKYWILSVWYLIPSPNLAARYFVGAAYATPSFLTVIVPFEDTPWLVI